MDRLIVLFLALFVASFSRAADSSDLEDWKLVSDRNDIQVYMKHRDESRLKTFRGVTRFQLAGGPAQ